MQDVLARRFVVLLVSDLPERWAVRDRRHSAVCVFRAAVRAPVFDRVSGSVRFPVFAGVGSLRPSGCRSTCWFDPEFRFSRSGLVFVRLRPAGARTFCSFLRRHWCSIALGKDGRIDPSRQFEASPRNPAMREQAAARNPPWAQRISWHSCRRNPILLQSPISLSTVDA